MVEFLVSWAEQLIIALVIIIMLEMVIPNSSYRKYIKIILGIFILYVIFNPLIKNKVKKIDIEEEIRRQTNSINITTNPSATLSYNNQIETVYKQKFRESLSSTLIQKGYELITMYLDIDYMQNDIKTNKLECKIAKLQESKNINIEKIKISEKKLDISEGEIEEIKKEISNTYNIELSKIFIESEKSQ